MTIPGIQQQGTQFIEGFLKGAAEGLTSGKGIQQSIEMGVMKGLEKALGSVPGMTPMLKALENLLPGAMNPAAGGGSQAGQGVGDKLQKMLGDGANAMLSGMMMAAMGPAAGGAALAAMGGDPMKMLTDMAKHAHAHAHHHHHHHHHFAKADGANKPASGDALEQAGREALKFITGKDTQPAAGGSDVSAQQTLRDNFDHLKTKDGCISLQTINDIAAGKNCPDGSKPSPELKAACEKMRDNPDMFKAADTAKKGDPGKADMLVSKDDLDTVIKKQSPQQQLLDNFDKLKGKDNLITLQTINDIAAGKNCPDGSVPSPELKAACEKLRDNPDLFKAVDTARQGDLGKADMLVSKKDLETSLH